ncbi:P-loop containing nucleoside triphosphate hydrolase protein [Thozetella sp. PMI_491]|nr:P-loop containing nucleoside triphosphate hydrolase protein [Thozetella sp. PMI_491]
MVDYKCFNRVVLNSKWLGRPQFSRHSCDPYPESIKNDVSDLGDLAMLIPADVPAFCIGDRRQWIRLHLDQIHPVTWNQDALGDVVLPRSVKDLAVSLVMSRTARERALPAEQQWSGKALTMHIHGPSGSGKTMLARALAETAQLPLYVVPAGLISTTPELWSKFVNHIRYLGNAWQCILLLDNSDAFMAKRTPCPDGSFDHHDVGIAAWFNKLLDDFPGIIILTSQTVPVEKVHPTIRNRINVSLALDPLSEVTRAMIWKQKLAAAGLPPGHDSDIQSISKREFSGWQIKSIVETAVEISHYHNRDLEWRDVELTSGSFQGEKKKFVAWISDNE